MKNSILLSEPDGKFSESIKNSLMAKSFEVEVVSNGKDCQMKAFHTQFSYLVINYEIKNHSVIEVLKYFKTRPSCPKIILTIPSALQNELSKELLRKLGVSEVISYPYSESTLVGCIGRMNQLEGLASELDSIEQQIRAVKDLTKKYLDEIFHGKFTASNVEYGNKLGLSIYDIVKKQPNFHQFLQGWLDYESDIYNHTFMVVFFSMLICKTLEWDNPRTIQVIALAGLVHDIGISKLPKEMWDKSPTEGEPGFKEYSTHPRLGLDILQDSGLFTEPVIQIVYQHHETSDGLGFPNKLTDKKIYPLAKVVIVADYYARALMEYRTVPFVALQRFVTSKDKVQKLDHNILKALIKSFMKAVPQEK